MSERERDTVLQRVVENLEKKLENKEQYASTCTANSRSSRETKDVHRNKNSCISAKETNDFRKQHPCSKKRLREQLALLHEIDPGESLPESTAREELRSDAPSDVALFAPGRWI